MVQNPHKYVRIWMTYWSNPGNSGHLYNQDTYGGPQGVCITQITLYTFACTHYASV